jgi:solute carrier family 34 (sodium-dependent phosphate cotransporter)
MTEFLRGAEFDATAPGRSPIRVAVKLPVDGCSDLLDPGGITRFLLLGVGLLLIFLALGLITRNMRRLVAGGVERVMNRIIGRGGGAVGHPGRHRDHRGGAVVLHHHLDPGAAGGGRGAHAPSAYPITLGANVGTTITALIASLAVLRPEGLTIASCTCSSTSRR